MCLPISVFIIAFNEVERIGRAIESVIDLVDEVIVIDSGSTDGTQALARSLGANVMHHDWSGYGAQKKFGERACSREWLLNIDADEVVTSELRDEIIEIFSGGAPVAAAYSVRIAEVFPGEESPRRFAYCHKYVRLYHASVGEFSSSPVHDVVRLRGGSRSFALRGRINHFTMIDIGSQVDKYNKYTDVLVDEIVSSGRGLCAIRLLFEFPVAFFKAYLLRRYCVRGGIGFILSMNYAIFRYLRVAKFLERSKVG